MKRFSPLTNVMLMLSLIMVVVTTIYLNMAESHDLLKAKMAVKQVTNSDAAYLLFTQVDMVPAILKSATLILFLISVVLIILERGK